MRYSKIDNKLFKENRERFKKEMKPNSVAIFFSNDRMPRNADTGLTFYQNTDLFWLTGIDQEETMLVLFPDCKNEDFREMLFVRETSEHLAIWEGDKLTKVQATENSGIESVQWSNKWEAVFPVVMNLAENCYLNLNEHDRYSSPVQYADLRFAKGIMDRFPLHEYERSAPIMHRLRSVKSAAEIELMKKACSITASAFERVLKFIKPCVLEYEIEAEIMHEFIRSGSKGHAYEPIIASGKNSCVLHYIQNENVCKDGDILLMDFGAEYANYNSDLTRCVPVNGKFSPRQKEVYNAVLRIFYAASGMLAPGVIIKEYQEKVGKLMEKELVELGLLTMDEIKGQDEKNPAYKKFFMHGTSHYLGLDVHDLGSRYQPMTEGMVFTVEPGIYIREEGLGIRIESDFLVTSGKAIDLMPSPITVEEIEDRMKVEVKV
jgi:Xaa-Pro aminopeptidase